MKWTEKTLNILGLSTTEITILNNLPTAKSVQEIAGETGLSRTGVNHVLNILIHKGFITSLLNRKRRLYISITQKELCQKLQEGIDELDSTSRDKKGARIRTSKENEFIIHIGTTEIIPAYQRIVSFNKNERIKAIQHHCSWNELIKKISPTQLIEFNQSLKKNNIILEGMLNASAYNDYKNEVRKDSSKHQKMVESIEGRMADYATFPDKFFKYNAEIWIFKTTALIINWHEEVAIEITNASMTGFLKDMFEFVKAGGNKIDHNKAIREVLKI